jgi:hypothetical protein
MPHQRIGDRNAGMVLKIGKANLATLIIFHQTKTAKQAKEPLKRPTLESQ